MADEARVASLVEEAAAGAGWQVDGCHVAVLLRAGRHQRVSVDLAADAGVEYLRLISRVGDAAVMNEARLRAALGMNARLRAGALAIEQGFVVVVDTVPMHLASAMLPDAILRLAGKADEFERGLFGVDVQ